MAGDFSDSSAIAGIAHSVDLARRDGTNVQFVLKPTGSSFADF